MSKSLPSDKGTSTESEGGMNTIQKGNITLSGLLVGAAVGAVVGAGVALLFAPKTGKETREWLGAKTSQAKGKLGEAIERARAVVRHEAQDLNSVAKTLDSPTH